MSDFKTLFKTMTVEGLMQVLSNLKPESPVMFLWTPQDAPNGLVAEVESIGIAKNGLIMIQASKRGLIELSEADLEKLEKATI